MSAASSNPIPVGLSEIKKALWKKAFRDLFPSLEKEIKEYLNNPGCKCNQPLFNTILQERQKLEEYFGGEITLLVQPANLDPVNDSVVVINTHKDQLEEELRRLPVGRKLISLARYENEITAVIQFV